VLLEEKNLNKLIVVGDRLLIKPKTPESRTRSGLLLPPGVQEKEKVQMGYVVKVGPGYPIPSVTDIDEPWKARSNDPQYVPLQPHEGDLAVYMQNAAVEIEFNKVKYVVVSQSAVLLLVRDEGLFE
jgi:co-chaperonin GroES (HSP10)